MTFNEASVCSTTLYSAAHPIWVEEMILMFHPEDIKKKVKVHLELRQENLVGDELVGSTTVEIDELDPEVFYTYSKELTAPRRKGSSMSGSSDSSGVLNFSFMFRVGDETSAVAIDPEYAVRLDNLVLYLVPVVGDELVGSTTVEIDELDPEVFYTYSKELTAPRRKGSSMSGSSDSSGVLNFSFMFRVGDETSAVAIDPEYAVRLDNLVLYLVMEDFLMTQTLVEVAESISSSFSSNSEFFQALTNSFLKNGFAYASAFVSKLLSREISTMNSSNIIFRENSTGNGIIVFLCRKLGATYALKLLKPLIKLVMEGGSSLEIDPRRVSMMGSLTVNHSLESNVTNFQNICKKFVKTIVASLEDIPLELRCLAHQIHKIVGSKFPDARRIALSSFFFLRFLCPLIISSLQEDIVADASKDAKRNLILVTKTLQVMANGTEPHNDEYLVAQLKFINKYSQRIESFLFQLGDIDYDASIKSIQHKEASSQAKSPSQSLYIIHKKILDYREALIKKNKAIEHILDAIDEQVGPPQELTAPLQEESPTMAAVSTNNSKGFFSKIKGRMKIYGVDSDSHDRRTIQHISQQAYLSLMATMEQKDKEIAELRTENALLREKNVKLEKKIRELTKSES
eukprot:TRINITY_DN16323_c0_g1_i4.p2 TRINITY_DN16323_c0_g1~~TRINITY_DN16323_c0_g1_i4.p2  ORF type:complete len:628 (-),score=147.60 TRINITY_DN16323_c0_g1_i4:2289-4172(-)